MLPRIVWMLLVAVGISACSSTPEKAVANPAPAPMTKVRPAIAAEPQPVKPAEKLDPRKQAGTVLAKRSIFFDFDKSTIKPEYQDIVSAHARFLAEHGNLKMVLQGNADERGSSEYNLALGQRRAESVSNAMSLTGASKSSMEAISFGKEKPRALGHDETAWSQNRRVDIRYSDDADRK